LIDADIQYQSSILSKNSPPLELQKITKNIKIAWDIIFKFLNFADDIEFTYEHLFDRNHTVAKAIMYIYNMESHIFKSINDKDQRHLEAYSVFLSYALCSVD
jgi:hypothetical protein